jgi:hypothetical protein
VLERLNNCVFEPTVVFVNGGVGTGKSHFSQDLCKAIWRDQLAGVTRYKWNPICIVENGNGWWPILSNYKKGDNRLLYSQQSAVLDSFVDLYNKKRMMCSDLEEDTAIPKLVIIERDVFNHIMLFEKVVGFETDTGFNMTIIQLISQMKEQFYILEKQMSDLFRIAPGNRIKFINVLVSMGMKGAENYERVIRRGEPLEQKIYSPDILRMFEMKALYAVCGMYLATECACDCFIANTTRDRSIDLKMPPIYTLKTQVKKVDLAFLLCNMLATLNNKHFTMTKDSFNLYFRDHMYGHTWESNKIRCLQLTTMPIELLELFTGFVEAKFISALEFVEVTSS